MTKMSLYNVHHPRSTFRFGAKVRISMGAGCDSRKEARVCDHFPWREESGAYAPPEKTDVPIELEDGRKRYFPKNYLSPLMAEI